MTAIDWKRARPLLARLLELPEGEHTAFLEEACPNDTELARTVRRLYAQERAEGDFLEPPHENERLAVQPLGAGDTVGPYRLIRELGRGGMGQVWLAERTDTFEQQVALKLVKLGMDTEEVVRRFRRERQLLADLDHPGIVRLLDGGATAEGRPYLALECVEGTPLDQHCRARGLSIDARLELFARVCEAVESAHDFGVVHRDLKPSNVLVTAAGDPKVLDFGIAKVLSDEGPELSLLTRTGERLLTPRYAAPEQVRGGTCTPSTDVYALGVMLYELLCDRPPYQLETASVRDIETAVCEETPRRPSATAKGATRRRLMGDLDVIAMRALAKEPERRYRDAGHLARDIRHHLAHEPIEARPETTGYRVRKFVRRNRWLVGSTSAVIAALVVGLVIATTQYMEARRQTLEAEWRSYISMIQSAQAQLEADRTGVVAETHRPEFYGWEADHLRARDDLSTGLVQQLEATSDLAIDGAGTTLAAAEGSELVLIDTRTREVRRRVETGAPIRAHALSAAGDLVAVSHGRKVQVLALDSLEVVAEWEGTSKVNQLLFHPDGQRLVDASGDVASLRSLANPGEARELARNRELRGIALSPSGDRFAAAGNGTIDIVGIDDPALSTSFRFGEVDYHLNSVAFSRTGRYLGAVVNNGIVRFWDLSTNQPISLPIHTNQYCYFIGFRPDRDEALAAGRAIQVWDMQTGAHRSLPGTSFTARGWAIHPVEPRLFVSYSDGRIVEWDIAAEQIPRHPHLVGWLRDVAVSPDGSRYAISFESRSRALAICDLETGAEISSRTVKGLGARLHDLVYLPDREHPEGEHPDGEHLAGALSNRVARFDADDLEVLDELALEDPRSLALDSDGGRVLVGTYSGRLVEIATSDWSLSRELENDFERITEAVYHPDGRRMAIAGKGASGVSLLDPVTGRALAMSGVADELALAVAISPDGRWIAAGFETHLRVWSAETGSLVLELSDRNIRAVRFTPDGRRLLTVGARLEVIETSRWKPVVTFQDALRLISDMAFAPDGTLVTCDRAGEVLIWNVADRQP